jgi:hypothetical protein
MYVTSKTIGPNSSYEEESNIEETIDDENKENKSKIKKSPFKHENSQQVVEKFSKMDINDIKNFQNQIYEQNRDKLIEIQVRKKLEEKRAEQLEKYAKIKSNICWQFALKYEDALRANPKFYDLVEKSKRKYPLLKTQHLLYVFGLAEDKFLQLIENPRLLIHALYHHDSILESQKKEINKLCLELANLYDLDLMTIQLQLIRSWLAFTEVSHSEEHDANETVYEDYMGGSANNEEAVVSDENVIRAYYILGSWNNSTALDFLASEMSSDRIHAENQLQLYECFAKLIDENSTNYMEFINTKKYLLIRVCYFLKLLGYNIKPDKFESTDKIELLKRIWTGHNNNPRGLEVMVLICLGFNIHLPQIWNGILKQMVTYKMVNLIFCAFMTCCIFCAFMTCIFCAFMST